MNQHQRKLGQLAHEEDARFGAVEVNIIIS